MIFLENCQLFRQIFEIFATRKIFVSHIQKKTGNQPKIRWAFSLKNREHPRLTDGTLFWSLHIIPTNRTIQYKIKIFIKRLAGFVIRSGLQNFVQVDDKLNFSIKFEDKVEFVPFERISMKSNGGIDRLFKKATPETLKPFAKVNSRCNMVWILT